MHSAMVRVPAALLLHRQLSNSAKLLWIVLQQAGDDAAPRTGQLQARSGLGRHTVLQAMAELRALGWLPHRPDPAGAARQSAADDALIPADLLPVRHVGVQAKLLYACLQRLAGDRHPRGECTLAQLCELAGASLSTVKRALHALQAAGWLECSQRNKFSPIGFLLGNPVARRREETVARAAWRLNSAPYRGEGLMRAYLSLLVDSVEHDDDASPAFLVNPFTGEEMQFDRYYASRVAFEFQGPQHYGPTDHYADETQVLKQQARDYMKQRICATRGIHLVLVHPEDLTLERMRQKVQGHLPLRDLAGHEAMVTYLEETSRAYRRKAREGRTGQVG